MTEQEKQMLEEIQKKEWEKCLPKDEGLGLEITEIEHEQFDTIAAYFYNLGLQKGKEE